MADKSWSDHASSMAYVAMTAMVCLVIYVQNKDRLDPMFREWKWAVEDKLAALGRSMHFSAPPRSSVEQQVKDLLAEKPSERSA